MVALWWSCLHQMFLIFTPALSITSCLSLNGEGTKQFSDWRLWVQFSYFNENNYA